VSTIAAATSDHASSSSEGVSDSDLGSDVLFGFVVGTPLVYALVVVMCLVAGTSLFDALAVSILPSALSGVFFGGVFPLSRQMARHEAAERDARRAVASVAIPVVDVVEVLPAA
jgi:hypothetical protein